MSTNDWERGEIVIPTSEWASFKKKVRDAYNAYMDKSLAVATARYNALIAAGKGEKNPNWAQISHNVSRADRHYDEYFDCHHLIFPWESRSPSGAFGAPVRPLAKMFPHATNRTDRFDMDEATIRFSDDDKHKVLWSVQENNHACERARNHPVGIAFFKALKQVAWTNQSGGTIVGNDEYNRDSSYEGGGSNYAKDRFGKDAPKSKPASPNYGLSRPRF